MHILIIPSWYPVDDNDLSGSFFKEQAKLLMTEGHKIGVIAPILKQLIQLNISNIFLQGFSYSFEDNIPTFRYSTFFWFPKLPYLNLYLWLRIGKSLFKKYCLRYGYPDIIIAQSMLYSGILASQLKSNYHIPYFCIEHSSSFARGYVKKWEYSAIKKALRNSDALFCVSSALQKILSGKLHLQHEWKILPNPIASSSGKEISPKQKGDFFQYIHVSSLDENKRVDLLIQAFSEVVKIIPKSRLLIVGNGTNIQNLIKICTDHNLGNNVEFYGSAAREEIPSLLKNSNVFVLTSEVETFGIVLIEALSEGLPIISTKSGGPDDIVNSRNGVLIPINDIDRLIEAMINVYENYNSFNRSEIASECFELYGTQNYVAKIEKTCLHILNKETL